MSVTGSLDLGTLHLKLRADKTGLKRDLEEAKVESDQAGASMGRSWWQTLLGWMRQIGGLFRRGGKDAADGFWRDAQGRLHDHQGRFVAEGRKIGSALGQALGDGAASLLSIFGQLGSGAGGLTRHFGTMALVLGVLAAAFVFTIPLVYALGGALAALPALTTGGIAALATLLIGFSGLTDAFKKHASAGGSVVDRARQVAMAERRLADAQREALAAQEDINRAREEAAEQLEDLDRGLRGARFEQEDAVRALAVAERDLAMAQRRKDPKLIEAATDAYERAQLQLETVNDRVDDLEKAQAKATAAGVEGSQQVQNALRQQERATREVEDATYDLGKAGKSAAGGAAEETTKLAASALLAVAAIKSLKQNWTDLRLDVQEKLFAGTDVELKTLWASWESTLHTRLGSMATMFNGLFKTWAATSKKPEFISNIAAGWESIEHLIDRVGKAIAGPGLEAFGKLSKAAKPFVDMLGGKLGGLIEHFADWIAGAEKSGALTEFFDKATKFFSDLWDIGGDVVGILGEFFSLWDDSGSGESAKSLFDTIKDGLHDLREWLKDPENRKELRDLIDGIMLGATLIGKLFAWLATDALPFLWQTFGTTLVVLHKLWDGAKFVIDSIVKLWTDLWTLVTDLGKKIKWSEIWDGIVAAGKVAFNAVAGMWNNTLGGFSFKVPEWVLGIGGKEIKFPKIPLLAHGGLVPATPGGRLVIAGEGGQDEIVSPEDQMRRIVAEELARVLASGDADGGRGGITVEKLEVKAYSDRFSLTQVERELSLHGVH